ncbi:SAC3 domain-containing protein 1-like [Anoplophora glabripennis]|uniref:SAC3 domain-containing protein 1-like n=1 Tax=Anoplophora glabripennis TaxID=217634 RepID=UPI000873DC45|nr:SAC3 domain-containing protein 1-like [Anoplophora glabripennis]XP_018578476.1 SAC3 domain-containing protein 1-like [Anoplophora glabripennis]
MESLESYVVGICQNMCPDEEIKLREKESLLHTLEVVPGTERDRKPKADRSRMVKTFCRSAAGKSMQDPKNLRPPNILLKTLNYLLDDIISRKDLPWTVIYDFVMDRLRSIRQDLVIQNSSKAYCISILQPIVRFHAYASYRLCEENINSFDPVINTTHLQECLKRLLCMYDCCEEISGKDGEVYSFLIENRPHFEALYLVLNLGDSEAIIRPLNLSKIWRTDVVETALELSLSYTNSNFIRVCRLIKQLPILLQAVATLHLPKLRRTVLKIMSVAYSSKNLIFPVHVLKSLLLYNNDRDVFSDCKYYGLEVRDNGICFLRSSFNDNKMLPPSHQDFVDQKLNDVSVSTLILFGDE